jgi:hypothetical protein
MHSDLHLARDFYQTGRSEEASDAEEHENSDEGFRPRIEDENGAGIERSASVVEGRMFIRALAEVAGVQAATVPMSEVMAMTR